MLSNLRNKLAKMAVQPRIVATPNRGIKLHEYQAGALLDSYKVAIPLGQVATTVEEAHTIAKGFANGCVVKS
jgi:succinyl-CoA synthetase beta subunit